MSGSIKGKVHSIQSLGTVDGPGVRFVVFTQGCNLRCGCCQNPDTWDLLGGIEFYTEDIVNKAVRYKEYFGDAGGITVSGGEPLLQPEFVSSVFKLSHENGINTCLDTSGSILNENVFELLKHTDRVLLDIKYTDDEQYKKYVGCSLESPLQFLKYLDAKNIPTTVRQVIIPTLNDNETNIKRLSDIVRAYQCVDKVELLPFKKLCKVKYDDMKIDFPFSVFKETDTETIDRLNSLL